MAAMKTVYNLRNLLGEYIEYHFQTDADIVLTSDGSNLQAHVDDAIKHLTEAEKLKLFNLPADSLSTFATKAEVAGFQTTKIVADITERDALEDPLAGTFVYVQDASDDSSVTLGGATYLFDGTAYIKVAEWESMDVTITWDNIQNKPTSTVAEIDEAVTKTHEHSNKTLLDGLSTSDGRLELNGVKLANLEDVQASIIVSETEPTTQMAGQVWLKPVAEEESEG